MFVTESASKFKPTQKEAGHEPQLILPSLPSTEPDTY